jgi:hypothetical protein
MVTRLLVGTYFKVGVPHLNKPLGRWRLFLRGFVDKTEGKLVPDRVLPHNLHISCLPCLIYTKLVLGATIEKERVAPRGV